MSNTHNKEEIFSQKPYNPFAFLQSEADCLAFVDGMIKNFQPNEKIDNNPLHSRARCALLRAIVLYLYKECRQRERTFANVMKLLCAAEKENYYQSPLDVLFEDLREKDAKHKHHGFRKYMKVNLGYGEYMIYKEAPDEIAAIIIEDIENNLEAFGWIRCVRRPSVPAPYIHYMQQQARLLKKERAD